LVVLLAGLLGFFVLRPIFNRGKAESSVLWEVHQTEINWIDIPRIVFVTPFAVVEVQDFAPFKIGNVFSAPDAPGDWRPMSEIDETIEEHGGWPLGSS
jgi:hypothetical protein